MPEAHPAPSFQLGGSLYGPPSQPRISPDYHASQSQRASEDHHHQYSQSCEDEDDNDDGGFRICHSQSYFRPATQLVPDEEEDSLRPWEQQAPTSQMPQHTSTVIGLQLEQMEDALLGPLNAIQAPLAQVSAVAVAFF